MAYNFLIVDDSATVCAVIERTLKITGLPINEVFKAANGEEGLKIIKEQWVDFVFTDLNMPIMNGIQMIEKMAEDDMLKSVPVVIVSTEGSRVRIEELIQRGARAYIRKPFTPESLLKVFNEIIGVQHEH